METVVIYDEMDRPYICEVSGTRVLRILSGPPLTPETESQENKHCDAGWMNDVRFGTEVD